MTSCRGLANSSGAAGGGVGAVVGKGAVGHGLARFKESSERVGVVFRRVLGAAHAFAAVFGPLSFGILAVTLEGLNSSDQLDPAG